MTQKLRIGIPIIGGESWLGGVCYIDHLVKALASLPEPERPELYFILNEFSLPHLKCHQATIPYFKAIIYVGSFQKDHPEFYYTTSHRELLEFIDFYFPLMNSSWPTLKVASWIPDFQHLYLPQFFDKEELESRAENFGKMAKESQLMVFSSESARDDFHRFYPDSTAMTRVLRFYALPQESWYCDDFEEVQQRYGLPDRFLICSNQLWAHKNHPVLFEAIAKLYRQGIEVHLACTGYTKDYRAPGYFDALKEILRILGIEHLVHILGNIPRHDQIQLVRRSMAVVQPSLFEGWSTVVEDCRVLGKTMILSDLPVHKEQAPRHGVYFDRNSSDALAQTIGELLPRLAPGPDPIRERDAAAEAQVLVQGYGRCFCSIVREATAIEDAKQKGMILRPVETPPTPPQIVPLVKKPLPRITLVTPSYNYGQYLEACLDSVLSQNYPNLEYIVMDGGSTDNTVEILKRYQKHFTYWQSGPDGGNYAAIDEGFRRSTGEIMTWLNADDMFHPRAFHTAAEIFMSQPEVEWIMGRPNCFDEKGNQKVVVSYLPLNSRARYLADEDFIQQEGVFWRRPLWERAGSHIRTDMKLAADLELWARFFRHAPLHAVDTLLAGFRDHPLQKSKDKAGYTAEANVVLAREREIFAAERTPFNPPAPLPILIAKKEAA